MSVKVSSWVWHETPAEVKGNKLVALLALADIADDNGNCIYSETTSQAALAEKTRMSVSQFREVTNWLEQHGYLLTERPSRTAEKTYRICATADFRRSDSGGRTAGNQRSGAPESGGRSSYTVIDVLDVGTSDADGVDGYSEDVHRLCSLLASLVSANGHRVTSIGKRWHAAADRLLRLDGYTADQVEIVARWATANEFWSANIRSMPTLREKFSTLRLQRNSELEKRQGRSTVEHGRSVDEILAAREAAERRELEGARS